MARRQFFQQGKVFIAEFPHDPAVGWEKDRRGIRRRLGHVNDFAHLSEDQTQQELMRRWYETERILREEQSQAHHEKERKQREQRALKVRAAAELWKKSLEVTNKGHTRTEYMRSIELYVRAIGNHALSEYQASFAVQYKKYLRDYRKQNGEPMSACTQQKHIRHMNVFFSWAFEHEIIRKQVKIKGIKTPRKDMQTLEVHQLDSAIEYVRQKLHASTTKTDRNRYQGLDRAMTLARHTILRSGAIWALKLEHIDLKNRIIRIVGVPEIGWTPKALKFPIKPINDELYHYLKADLANRDPKEVWFLDDGRGMQWRKVLGNLTREASNLFQELDYPKMKPFHEAFRSTLITHMLVSGVPITTVQQLADHSSIQTTYGYLDTRRVQQQQAANALAFLQRP